MVTGPQTPGLDPLTWLPNRVLFEARLVSAVRDVQRRRGSLALLLIDLDRMELVNASLGRDLGDRILHQAAARMARALGPAAMLARLESDDFAAFIEVPDQAAALKHAALLLEACGEPYVVECLAAIVTVSIGIALHPRDGLDPETLLARADAAMYRAKQTGKNRVVLFAEAPA